MGYIPDMGKGTICALIPNRLTAKTLRESNAGKNVKVFADKGDFYADLGPRRLLSSKKKNRQPDKR
jgi:hypothetical protein